MENNSIDAETLKEEKEEDKLDEKNNREEETLYQTIIVNNFEKINVKFNT